MLVYASTVIVSAAKQPRETRYSGRAHRPRLLCCAQGRRAIEPRPRHPIEGVQFTFTTSFIFGWMPHSTWKVPRSVKVTGVRLPGSWSPESKLNVSDSTKT
jgi:hypothetical protein